MKLGHVNLKVRDPGRAAEFYTRHFGFRLSERVGDEYVFLTLSDAHHELALQRIGQDATLPPTSAVGLNHVAFELPDAESFARTYRGLLDAGIRVRAVDHGISWALYLTDPDGNGLEVYIDTRGSPGGRGEWRGESKPLAPQTILASLKGEDG